MNCFRFVRTHHVLNREYEIHYILRFKYNFIEARGGKSVFDKVSSVIATIHGTTGHSRLVF